MNYAKSKILNAVNFIIVAVYLKSFIGFHFNPAVQLKFQIGKRSKIFDCVLYNSESHMLYNRIWRLQPYVDHFVVVSASLTFSSRKNNVSFYPFDKEIQALGDKIHLFELNLSANMSNWAREEIQRNSMLDFVKTLNPKEGDIIIAGDIDEIPTISGIEFMIQNPPVEDYYNTKYRFYNHNYNSMVKTTWGFTAVFKYSDKLPSYLLSTSRSTRHFVTKQYLGTHCSSCFHTLELYKNKYESFSHQEFNSYPFTNYSYIFWSHYCKKQMPWAKDLYKSKLDIHDLAPQDPRLRFLYDKDFILDINKTIYKEKDLKTLCKGKNSWWVNGKIGTLNPKYNISRN